MSDTAKTMRTRPTPPSCTKDAVDRLLDLIAGHEPLTIEMYRKGKDWILYAVRGMQALYERVESEQPKNPDVLHYKEAWNLLDAARTDEETLRGIERLRDLICEDLLGDD